MTVTRVSRPLSFGMIMFLFKYSERQHVSPAHSRFLRRPAGPTAGARRNLTVSLSFMDDPFAVRELRMRHLVKRDEDWLADVSDAAGRLIGRIQIGETRRHYTLLDETDQVAGKAVGDLAVKQFTITGPEGERFARLRKTWAGLGKELLTSSDHYTVTFTGPMPPRIRVLVVMVPIVLDMTRHGPYCP